mmetsp:Transcript_86444/g.207024  ORF Transcript_86444/g.207024 Transcript_86444/m.207024 type:complete len:200 (-) Transcript_86444:744-1343(-)
MSCVGTPCASEPSITDATCFSMRSIPFVKITISLAVARPERACMPPMNSSKSSSPSPSVSSSMKSCRSVSSVRPMMVSLFRMLSMLKAFWNSSNVTCPLPSSSSSRNISWNSLSSCSRCSINCFAMSASSHLEVSKASLQMMAVTKLSSTKEEQAVNIQRKIQMYGCCSINSSIMPCASSACINLVRVSIAFHRPKKRD